MLQNVFEVTVGALLHDIGKVIFRAESLDSRAHPISGYDAVKEMHKYQEIHQQILHCIRYHHKKHLANSQLPQDDLAYIVYYADNIAAGMDRRMIEGDEDYVGFRFKKHLPIASVFNLVNNNTAQKIHHQGNLSLDQGINFPVEPPAEYTAGFYNKTYQAIKEGLQSISFEPKYVNSILTLLEGYLTYVPSSTNQEEVADISLFDHSKITAALASCLCLYLTDQNRENLAEALFHKEEAFGAEPAFLMCSCDISGIQSFIYTTSGEDALKSLRARSLYLEILLEHLADEILTDLGLSRANLMYTGGGRADFLLPNTSGVQAHLTAINEKVNQWLIENFGSDLYLIMGWSACSSNDLLNKGDLPERYQAIFQRLAKAVSHKKNCRYSAQELRTLNQLDAVENSRECQECKRSSHLLAENICTFCANLKLIAKEAVMEDCYFAVMEKPLTHKGVLPLPNKGVLPLPNVLGENVYLQVIREATLCEALVVEGKVLRFYSKNNMVTGKQLATKIWMADYHVTTGSTMATFEDLAALSQGIKRIGVLRADIDNLGQTFSRGFVHEGSDNPYQYMTISRTATLSRSLSMFFKYYLNFILGDCQRLPFKPFSLLGDDSVTKRQVNVIYSGGDDLFLVGAWQEVLECAIDIRRVFAKYAQGTLTLSAGFGVFDDHYPLIRMAQETGELEDQAKHFDHGAKNAIALFGADSFTHVYHWDQLEEEVIGEKLRFLQKHLGHKADSQQNGTAFVYSMMELLRHADEQINVARFAYMLGKRPISRGADATEKQRYQEFNATLYRWCLNEKDRQQLITAIYLYIYLSREK